MRINDDVEVGVQARSEDTRYIKRLHRHETRSTSVLGLSVPRPECPPVCTDLKINMEYW